jgi:hypothetical protein
MKPEFSAASMLYTAPIAAPLDICSKTTSYVFLLTQTAEVHT